MDKRKKFGIAIRSIIAAVWIYGIYRETGWATASFAVMMFIWTEFATLIMGTTSEILKMLAEDDTRNG